MDRRNALKWMGISLAAAAMAGIAPLTHSAIVKDRQRGKKRLVFYFTATGNSLFVARQFSDSPISIPQELKKTELVYEADEIGIICPDYAGAIPKIVREFVQKATFKAPYMFSVITFGNACVNVAEYWDEFCQGQGVKMNYVRPILMVDNYLPVFDMNQQISIDKHTDENLATILEEVGAHKDFIAPAEMGFFNKEMLKGMQDQHFSMTADRLLQLREDRCVQCMTCANVCPHKNFSLADKGVSFSGNCEYCLACVHACPQKALTLRSEREGWPGERNPEARYRHPKVTLADIVRSNKQ